MLLAAPWPSKRTETINDLDCHITNFWRSVKWHPEEIAQWADWPKLESDLHARSVWLLNQQENLRSRLEGDPEWCDPKIAGWWCWGMCCSLMASVATKGPWVVVERDGVKHLERCPKAKGVGRQIPRADNSAGVIAEDIKGYSRIMPRNGGDAGVMSEGVRRVLPLASASGVMASGRVGAITEWMLALQARLSRVNVCCGHWDRIMGKTFTSAPGITAVFLDPPYSDGTTIRTDKRYANDDKYVAKDVRKWCAENGGRKSLHIALCGYIGEGHEELEALGWSTMNWSAGIGYSNQGEELGKNRAKEVVWFSPGCLRGQGKGGLLGI